VEESHVLTKAKELENINNKIEDKEERWFELSAKIEG
jgi:ATP-binding cassette subfamily F protein uup